MCKFPNSKDVYKVSDGRNDTDDGNYTEDGLSENEQAWREVQKESIMIDLSIVDDDDDESDEDYTEDMGNQELPKVPFKKAPIYIKIPSIDVAFVVPTTTGSISFRRFDDFSLPFVEAIVEKFNQDFLIVGSGYRRVYQRILKKGEAYIRAPCIRQLVSSRQQSQAVVGEDTNRACEDCSTSGQLCARIRMVDNKTTLLIYPLQDHAPQNEEWKSVGFWVDG
jgi:hypothetical protein